MASGTRTAVGERRLVAIASALTQQSAEHIAQSRDVAPVGTVEVARGLGVPVDEHGNREAWTRRMIFGLAPSS
jgi:hypothetical protein